jgi:hypothetical protein
MQKVEGSNPFIRSMTPVFHGDVAEWLRHGSAKPATPVRLRSSPLWEDLQNPGLPLKYEQREPGFWCPRSVHMEKYDYDATPLGSFDARVDLAWKGTEPSLRSISLPGMILGSETATSVSGLLISRAPVSSTARY